MRKQKNNNNKKQKNKQTKEFNPRRTSDASFSDGLRKRTGTEARSRRRESMRRVRRLHRGQAPRNGGCVDRTNTRVCVGAVRAFSRARGTNTVHLILCSPTDRDDKSADSGESASR